MWGFVVGWAVAAAAYVLFAGQFSVDELAAAAAGGLAASLWAASLRRVASRRFRFERGWSGAALRALAGVPGASVKVGLALVKAVATGGGGEIRREAFVQGRLADPADAGRRAVAVLGRSLAPDSFVIRVPPGEDAIEIHALVKTSGADPRWSV